MTDDDREPFEPGYTDRQGDEDPAQAFAALRRTVEKQGAQIGAEMTVIRRGVEAAFDQLDKFQHPADYSTDLGQIVQQLGIVAQHLEAVEKSPILKNGPEHYARALERSGESLVKTASQSFAEKTRDLERAAANLTAHVNSAYDRKSQDFRMWMAGLGGLIAGFLLLLLVPQFLPFSAASYVGAAVMGQDRWNAGADMMRAADPRGMNDLAVASRLARDNAEALTKCAADAQEAGKDRECTVVVKTTQP